MKTAVSLGLALRHRQLTNTHQMPMNTRNIAPANGVWLQISRFAKLSIRRYRIILGGALHHNPTPFDKER
jgi:hypothetical protein